jgi:hypothetical protein
MIRKAIKYFYFALTVIIVIAGLKFLSWVPGIFQRDTIREYESIASVSDRLGIKDIYTPSYFPQSIKWPPSEVIAQKKPFAAVIMGFKNKDNGEKILVIHQSSSDKFIPEEGIGFDDIKEMVVHTLDGKRAIIEVGSCRDGKACSSISWHEGEYNIKIMMKSRPLELLKIAESMKRR